MKHISRIGGVLLGFALMPLYLLLAAYIDLTELVEKRMGV